jgi:hypothetical protein
MLCPSESGLSTAEMRLRPDIRACFDRCRAALFEAIEDRGFTDHEAPISDHIDLDIRALRVALRMLDQAGE